MISDKRIQHEILEQLYNHHVSFVKWKSEDGIPKPSEQISVEIVSNKLKSIYTELNITIVTTHCFRLAAKGFIKPIHPIDEVFCIITDLGQYAYRSQLLLQENTYEENVDKHMRASILASKATTILSKNQIKFNGNIKCLTIIATIFVAFQTVFFVSQWYEMTQQTDLLKEQADSTYKWHKEKQSIHIQLDSVLTDALSNNDTVFVKSLSQPHRRKTDSTLKNP